MKNVTSLLQAGKAGFHQVACPFLDQPGLPFADALSAADIEQAFAERDAMFATEATFSTPIVLWAFLAQALRDGKGAACAAAVADIATYTQQVGGPVPSGDTGDYCRARAKLDLEALRGLTVQTARRLESQADRSWLFHGLHPKLIDGFTFTMPDTYDNQKQFPQQPNQRPGAGQTTISTPGRLWRAGLTMKRNRVTRWRGGNGSSSWHAPQLCGACGVNI